MSVGLSFHPDRCSTLAIFLFRNLEINFHLSTKSTASAVKRNPEYNWLEEVIPTSLPLGTLLRDPTIPSSSTAVTNRLPTEALAQSSDLSSKPPSQALLTGSSNTYSFEPDSLANPELPSVAHDGMDLDDQDELDEEI
jgi:hypothetical protein